MLTLSSKTVAIAATVALFSLTAPSAFAGDKVENAMDDMLLGQIPFTQPCNTITKSALSDDITLLYSLIGYTRGANDDSSPITSSYIRQYKKRLLKLCKQNPDTPVRDILTHEDLKF